MAGDNCTAAFRGRTVICRGELRYLPYYGELPNGNIRPQHNRICANRDARFSDPDSLRLLPRKQQLLVEFYGVHYLPLVLLAEHHDTRRIGSESHYGWVPSGLHHLPLHIELDDLNVQSQHDNLPVNWCAHDRGLRAVPREWKL